ncbi:MAG: ExeA family protein [Candidatus Binatia bacterium]
MTRAPFNVTPDPSFLYLSAGHKEALAQLIYGIRTRRGLVVLTGEVGTGKTTLIQSLLEQINDGHTRCALLFGLAGSPQDLLRSLCQEFGLISPLEKHKETPEYLTLLNRFLFDSYQNGDNVVVIIDEAQNLPAEVLERARLLSNFETKQDKLLQIVLVGQPELSERLNEPELRQLKQRVALRHHLSFLNFSECKEYIAKRLEISGAAASLFSEGAIQAVGNYSEGIPRLINIICDNGLLSAYVLRKPSVDQAMIDEIAQDLHLTAPRRGIHKRKNVRTKSKDISNRDRVDRPPDVTARADGERQNFVNHQSAVNATSRAELISADRQRSARSTDTPKVEASVDSRAEPVSALVPEELFQAMTSALTEATGPMAAVILREHLVAMGESKGTFPMHRLEQLLDQTGSEIANEKLRERFRRRMCEEIYAFKAGISKK